MSVYGLVYRFAKSDAAGVTDFVVNETSYLGKEGINDKLISM